MATNNHAAFNRQAHYCLAIRPGPFLLITINDAYSLSFSIRSNVHQPLQICLYSLVLFVSLHRQ